MTTARILQNDLQQMTKQSESPINLTPLDACLWTVGGSCSTWRESTQKQGEPMSRFWESIFDKEKYSFSIDRQLKKGQFSVCVFCFF